MKDTVLYTESQLGTYTGVDILCLVREKTKRWGTHAGVDGFGGFSHCFWFDLPGGNLSTDQRKILFTIFLVLPLFTLPCPARTQLLWDHVEISTYRCLMERWRRSVKVECIFKSAPRQNARSLAPGEAPKAFVPILKHFTLLLGLLFCLRCLLWRAPRLPCFLVVIVRLSILILQPTQRTLYTFSHTPSLVFTLGRHPIPAQSNNWRNYTFSRRCSSGHSSPSCSPSLLHSPTG